jgi:hypothetical protein
VNGIALRLFRTSLDQSDGGQDGEPAGQRGKSNIPEVVPQQTTYGYEAEANPPRHAAQPVVHGHGLSNWWSPE